MTKFPPPLLGACVLACTLVAPASAQTAATVQPPAQAPARAAARAPDPRFDIDAFDVEGNTLLDQETIETAVYPYAGPMKRRDDVAAARDALEKAYRAQGYATVVVEVPQQDARTGVVRLHVVEVPVGRLRVVGSQYSLPSRIKEQLPSLQEGKVPNFNQAQAELAEVNRLPERQVTPLEKKGTAPGTVDVDLRVKDTLPLHASAEVNNDHTQNTKQLRTVVNASYGDLWQLGHQVSITSILAPENLDNAQTYIGTYSLPLWNTPWSLAFTGTLSNSNVQAIAGTGVVGNGFTFGATGTLQLPPLGDFIETASVGIAFKHSINDLTFGTNPSKVCNALPPNNSRSCIDYLPVTAGYSLVRQSSKAFLSASAALTLGLRGVGSGVAAFENNRANGHANFAKLNLDASYMRRLWQDMQLAAGFSAQLADQPLLPNEQFSAGGLNTLRGYLQSEALGDDGVDATFTLSSPSLAPLVADMIGKGLIDDWRFFVFSDTAVAWVLDRLPEQRSVFPLASIGIGSKMDLLSHLTGNVVMGMPLRNGTATRAWHPTIQFSARTEF